tara:strand:- start:195 stop:905 length:711 start_codon:yes stop_codon:yes gene_type:complete
MNENVRILKKVSILLLLIISNNIKLIGQEYIPYTQRNKSNNKSTLVNETEKNLDAFSIAFEFQAPININTSNFIGIGLGGNVLIPVLNNNEVNLALSAGCIVYDFPYLNVFDDEDYSFFRDFISVPIKTVTSFKVGRKKKYKVSFSVGIAFQKFIIHSRTNSDYEYPDFPTYSQTKNSSSSLISGVEIESVLYKSISFYTKSEVHLFIYEEPNFLSNPQSLVNPTFSGFGLRYNFK